MKIMNIPLMATLLVLSIIGALLLIVLFQGSSSLAEEISGGKYPEYADYCHRVPRFFPGGRY